MMEIHDRRQAATLGLKKYWTGKPCKLGHVAFRYTRSGSCSTCVKQHAAAYAALANKTAAAKTRGRVVLQLAVHPDDRATVEAFVGALAAARMLDAGATLVPFGRDKLEGYREVEAISPERAAWIAEQRKKATDHA